MGIHATKHVCRSLLTEIKILGETPGDSANPVLFA